MTAVLFLVLTGCTQAAKSETYPYNWSAPLEQVTWGMNEEQMCKSLQLQSTDYEKSSDAKTLTLKKSYTLFGADAQVTVRMDASYGLSEIDIQYDADKLDTVLAALEKKYGKPSGTSGGVLTEDAAYQWVGTDLKKLNTAAQTHFADVLKKAGTSSATVSSYLNAPLPLVTIDFDCGKNSPSRGLCRFSGGKAAILESK